MHLRRTRTCILQTHQETIDMKTYEKIGEFRCKIGAIRKVSTHSFR